MRARLLPSPLVLTLALAAGCVTAKGAYTDGMTHETAGDYDAAAGAYATALERDRSSGDPSVRNAAGRLAVAGREAVRRHLAQAGASEPDQAARHYLAADGLVRRARRVGVEVAHPASLEADLATALDGAVAFLTDQAEAARAAGDYPGALGRLQQTAAFRPSAARQRDADALARAVYTDWARADLDAGAYRAGLAHVDQALAGAPGDDALLDLRDAILDAGTLVVAVLPAEGDEAPAAFLRDLTDVLVDERLALPPPFVAVVDPADVRRWDRRERRGPVAGRPAQLAVAARDLGADLGLAVVVGPVREQEVAGDARTVTASVQGRSERVAYSVRQLTLTLAAQADLVAVEVGGGRVVCDRTVTERAVDRYDRAASERDWRDLDLTRSARAAFAESAADDAYGRALDALRDRLATALAAEVARCVQSQVP